MVCKMVKVSVLVPFLNSEFYLKTCIDSILNQTFADFELILLNDGSTDGSEDIVKSYSDARIKYYKNDKNLGMVGSCNRLLEIATGEYLARMDSDDISLSTRIEKQVAFLDENPDVAMLGTWIELFNAMPANTIFQKIKKCIINMGWVWRHPQNVTLKETLRANTVMHPTMMMRRDALVKHNIKYNPEYNYAEDYDLVKQFLMSGLIVKNLPEVLLKYHYSHGNNTSLLKRDKLRIADARVKEDIRQYMQIKNYCKYPYWLVILRKLRLKWMLRFKISL